MLIALGCILLGSAFLMSNHYVPWTSFEPQWTAALGALLVSAAALVPEHAPADHRWRVPPVAWGALALACVPPMQLIFGLVHYRSDTLLATIYMTAFAAAVVAARTLAASTCSRFVPWLMGGLMVGAALSALIALLQWINIDLPTMYVLPIGRGDRPFANLAQPNHLAALLCLGLAATLYFYETRRLNGVATWACGAWLGWALVLTESRAGWVMFTLLIVWALAMRRRAALRLPFATVIAAGLLFAAAAALLPALSDALLLSQNPGSGPRLHTGSRATHWITLADAALRSPWFGYGWGQVSAAQVAAVLDHPATGEWIQNSHNQVLDLVIHNGLPIGLATTLLLAWWVVGRVRNCATGAHWAVLAGIGMVFAHTMFEFPLDYTYFLLPIGFLMGTLHAMETQAADAPMRLPLPRAVGRGFVAAAVLALAAMLGWIGVEYMKIESSIRQLRFVLLGVGVDKVPDAPLADVWLIDQPRDYHRFLLTSARPGLSDMDLDMMRRNATRQARPTSMLRLALALGLNGYPQESADWLMRICKMHSPARCDEGRVSWAAAQQQFPVLLPIRFPDTPEELLR